VKKKKKVMENIRRKTRKRGDKKGSRG